MKCYLLLAAFVFQFGTICAQTSVNIEQIPDATAGSSVPVTIALDNPSPSVEIGGFDLYILYDSSLSLQAVDMGQLLTDCQWEFFSSQQIGTDEIQIVAIAETNNGPAHPACFADSSGQLVQLTFGLPPTAPIGTFYPIRFRWNDCGDNAISSRFGDTLFISRDVYGYDGDSSYVITADLPFPTMTGAPSSCLSGSPGTIGRSVDFFNGGISIMAPDLIPPVAQCPTDIVVNNDSGSCGAITTFSATVWDNRPGAVIVCNPPSGTIFPVGITGVTCVATDAAGNTDSCGFLVTVHDTTPPLVFCPSDTIVANDPDSCGAIVFFDAWVTDNCPGATVGSNPPSGYFFPIGSFSVTCTAVDGSGNASACNFTLTVIDTTAPVVDCPADITVGNDPGECGASVSYSPNASDNCAGVMIATSVSSGSFFPLGSTPVQVIATDSSDNLDSCIFVVTVVDTEPPVVTCPPDTFLFNDSGQYGAIVDFDLLATDNCPDTIVDATTVPGSLFPIGTTLVEIVAIDAAANRDTCQFSVYIALNDPDSDGLPSWADNCPDHYNPLQADADVDAIGDSCDQCTDTDGDNYANPGFPASTCPVDNCPYDYNPAQLDANSDGVGDACCCAGVRGDVNGDGADLDIVDVTTLVTYLFVEELIIPCPDEGDANGDGSTGADVVDLTFVVDYLFGTAPTPVACP